MMGDKSKKMNMAIPNGDDKAIHKAVDEMTKKIERRRKAREKHITKKATDVTITIPKGCHLKETRRRIQEYVNVVLAEDADWDYAYLLDLIIYKLQRMQRCILKNNIIADAEKICAQMKTVEEALKRLRDDDYMVDKHEMIQDKYNVDYGTEKLTDGSGNSILITVDKKTRKKVSPKTERQHNADFRKACKMADQEIKKDLKIAFEGMRDNVLSWWE